MANGSRVRRPECWASLRSTQAARVNTGDETGFLIFAENPLLVSPNRGL
jgi:hypothetical protein